MKTRVCLTALLATPILAFFFCRPAAAVVGPDDLLVIYNARLEASRQVAAHYASRRGVPPQNLLGLDLPAGEEMSRAEYEQLLAAPLRQALRQRAQDGQAPVLVTCYGVPLKVGGIKTGPGDELWQQHIRDRVRELAQLTRVLAGRLAETCQLPAIATGPGEEEVPALLTRTGLLLQEAIGSGLEGSDRDALIVALAGFSALAAPQAPIGEDPAADRDDLVRLQALLESRRALLAFSGLTQGQAPEYAALLRLSHGTLGELKLWQTLREADPEALSSAAVDSELGLLLSEEYAPAKWLPNPHHVSFNALPGIEGLRRRTPLVARLDGPTPEIARRLVDEAMEAEEHGLSGVFYLDARGKQLLPGINDAYAAYDEHLRRLHTILKTQTELPVVFDDRPGLLEGRPLADAALYCGWYALTDYQDAFVWKKGAVGFHVASGEASTLRRDGSNAWCKRMLEEGVAATLGPVAEPYLHSFPLPDVFFPLLLTGRLPLVEVYYRSTPFLSWRQVLIGDPLYTPFRRNPALKGE